MASIEEILRSLQDTLAVTAAIQDRHAQMILYREQWLADNSRAIAQHREWLQQHEAAMHTLDEKFALIDDKLDRLADLILRGRGGNGGSA